MARRVESRTSTAAYCWCWGYRCVCFERMEIAVLLGKDWNVKEGAVSVKLDPCTVVCQLTSIVVVIY